MAQADAQFFTLQLIDLEGEPCAGARVETYVAGTTSLKTTWRDAARSAEQPNPIEVGADGRFWFYGDGEYRLRVLSADGALLYDWDHVRITADTGTMWEGDHGTVLPPTKAAAEGQMFARFEGAARDLRDVQVLARSGAEWQPLPARFKASTRGALPPAGDVGAARYVADEQRGLWVDTGEVWFHVAGEVYDVKSYGAKGDGTTDDTDPIQAALDACHEGGGGTVFLPRGTYVVNGIRIGDRTVLRGSGPHATILKNDQTSAIFGVVTNRDTTNGNFQIVVTDLQVLRTKQNQLVGVFDAALFFRKVGDLWIDRVTVNGDAIAKSQGQGIYCLECVHTHVDRCRVTDVGGAAIACDGDGAAGVVFKSRSRIAGNIIQRTAAFANFTGIYVAAHDVVVAGNQMRDNQRITDDTLPHALVRIEGARNVLVEGNLVENCELVYSAGGNCADLTIRGNRGLNGGDILIRKAVFSDYRAILIEGNHLDNANISFVGQESTIANNALQNFTGDATFAILVESPFRVTLRGNDVYNCSGGGIGIFGQSFLCQANSVHQAGTGPSTLDGRNAGFYVEGRSSAPAGPGWMVGNFASQCANNGFTIKASSRLHFLDNDGWLNGIGLLGVISLTTDAFLFFRMRHEAALSSLRVGFNPNGIIPAVAGSMFISTYDGKTYVKTTGSEVFGPTFDGWRELSLQAAVSNTAQTASFFEA